LQYIKSNAEIDYLLISLFLNWR